MNEKQNNGNTKERIEGNGIKKNRPKIKTEHRFSKNESTSLRWGPSAVELMVHRKQMSQPLLHVTFIDQ